MEFERRILSVTNGCIVEAVISYAQQINQAVYIQSGTGYVTDAILTTHSEARRYQGYGRIDTILGHMQVMQPSLIPVGIIHVEIAGLEPPMEPAIADRLIAHNTVLLEVYVARRPPPIVLGRRRRTRAFPPYNKPAAARRGCSSRISL